MKTKRAWIVAFATIFAGISLVFCILAFFGVIGRYPVL